MRRIYLVFLALAFSVAWAGVVRAAEYHLTTGDIIKGEPASITEDGVVFRLEIGGFSKQVRWARLTQDTLKLLLKDPRAAVFAQDFIDEPPEAQQEAKPKREIIVKPLDHPPRHEKIGFAAAWTTPAALVIVLLCYGANLYAAYEVARFRNRPAALVCGMAAVLPIFAPLIFLSLPTLEEVVEDVPAAAPSPYTETGVPLPKPQRPAETGTPGGAAGIGLAKVGSEAAGAAEPSVYKRGDYTFNRRFVETKFSEFFRVVGSSTSVLVVRTAKEEFVTKRISRISTNEMHIPLPRGTEQMVMFAEILEFEVKPGGAA